MNEEPVRSLPMPPTASCSAGTIALKDRVLVVVGANGAGKTRFGAWLDKQDQARHHRVSAHRSLSFPASVQPRDLVEAEKQLLNGHINAEPVNREGNRYGGQPATGLLDDYAHLLTVLVSQSYSVSESYRVEMAARSDYLAPPKTRMDTVREIWGAVLPKRELVVSSSRVEVGDQATKARYHPKEMSDGERGIFHLVAEALSTPMNGVFIIDEPELHLHRAIQARLWDAIEAARPDCAFVYITHDLGFAASRNNATRVWLRDFAPGPPEKWEWELVREDTGLPEEMLLELIGSRHPILFVEGDRGSLDHLVYGKLFPEKTIVPCGSCKAVIHATSSFAALTALHHNTCRGLVDDDGRPAEEIARLRELCVEVLPVAQIENLFLVDTLLTVSAEALSLDVAATLAAVHSRTLDRLGSHRIAVASKLTRQAIEAGVREIGKGPDGGEELASAFRLVCAGIEPAAIYANWIREIQRILDEKDYAAALLRYNEKGLAHFAADSVFGTNYPALVKRWLCGGAAHKHVAALRAAIRLEQPPPPAIARVAESGIV